MLSTSKDLPFRESEHPRANQLLVHFSDTHLLPGSGQLYDRVNSDAHLAEALEELESSGARPDAFVFTGDLADKGDPAAYAKLRALVDPVAQRMGATVIWLMGNHDDRAAFRTAMLGGLSSTEPIDTVYDLDGLRLIALDSSVPGRHHGALATEQLSWLADVLAVPAPRGTILAMHHPPIPSVLDLAVAVELHAQAALASVLAGTDVRTILAGHLHYSSTAMFAGIPVSVASATCYTQDLTAPAGSTRPRDGAQAFNLVHVYADTIVHSVVPIGRGPALQFTTAAESAVMLAASRIRIRE